VNYGQDPFEILIDLVNKHDEALTSLTDLTDEVNRLRKLVPDKEALEIVLDAAAGDAAHERREAQHMGPTKEAKYLEWAQETEAAIAKLRGSLLHSTGETT